MVLCLGVKVRTGVRPFRAQSTTKIAARPATDFSLPNPIRSRIRGHGADRDPHYNAAMTERPRFLADAMLGTLARWLRVLGFDVVYEAHIDDAALVEQAAAESRVILTRDRRLLERRLAREHLLIDSDDIDEQLRQVVEAFDLTARATGGFGRCLRCNTRLERIDAARVRDLVPAYVARTQTRFRYCPTCNRVFWRATHVEQMERRLRAFGFDLRRDS